MEATSSPGSTSVCAPAAASSSLASARSTTPRVSPSAPARRARNATMMAVASVGRQPERTGEVVGVGHPDQPLALERLEVDVDQVIGVAAGEAAQEQDAEVLLELFGRYADHAGGLLERHLLATVEVGHQPQQATDLVAGGARGRGRAGGAHAVTAAAARRRETTSSRRDAGCST